MEQKSYPDVFFFYDPRWSRQATLRQHLRRPECFSSAVKEIARLELIIGEDDSLARGEAMRDYNTRVVIGRRYDLRSKTAVQDYFAYLFTTTTPPVTAIAEAQRELSADAWRQYRSKKQNL